MQLAPDDYVEVTIKEVTDFSDVPPEILQSQIEGLQERLKTFDPATEEEVEAFFAKYTKSKT